MPWPFSLGPVALDFLFRILCFGFLACDLELLVYPSTKGPLAIDKSPTELSTKGPRSYRRKIHKVIYKRPTGWPWKKKHQPSKKNTGCRQKTYRGIDERPTELPTNTQKVIDERPTELSTKGPLAFGHRQKARGAIDKSLKKNSDKRPTGSWPSR